MSFYLNVSTFIISLLLNFFATLLSSFPHIISFLWYHHHLSILQPQPCCPLLPPLFSVINSLTIHMTPHSGDQYLVKSAKNIRSPQKLNTLNWRPSISLTDCHPQCSTNAQTLCTCTHFLFVCVPLMFIPTDFQVMVWVCVQCEGVSTVCAYCVCVQAQWVH